jgi:hypothetical protein
MAMGLLKGDRMGVQWGLDRGGSGLISLVVGAHADIFQERRAGPKT